MGIIFAFIQGFAYSFMMMKTASAFDRLYVSLILTAGTAFLLWLGDQVTTKGVGNGVSLIIMAGIVSNLPTMFISAFNKTLSIAPFV